MGKASRNKRQRRQDPDRYVRRVRRSDDLCYERKEYSDGFTELVIHDQEMAGFFRAQFAAFEAKFGRPPTGDDPVFFDPNADQPAPIPEDRLTALMVSAMTEAGIDPRCVETYRRTGIVATKANLPLMPPGDVLDYLAAYAEVDGAASGILADHLPSMRGWVERTAAGDPYADLVALIDAPSAVVGWTLALAEVLHDADVTDANRAIADGGRFGVLAHAASWPLLGDDEEPWHVLRLVVYAAAAVAQYVHQNLPGLHQLALQHARAVNADGEYSQLCAVGTDLGDNADAVEAAYAAWCDHLGPPAALFVCACALAAALRVEFVFDAGVDTLAGLLADRRNYIGED